MALFRQLAQTSPWWLRAWAGKKHLPETFSLFFFNYRNCLVSDFLLFTGGKCLTMIDEKEKNVQFVEKYHNNLSNFALKDMNCKKFISDLLT